MKMKIYDTLSHTCQSGRKMLAVLLDPESLDTGSLGKFLKNCEDAHVDFILVGGSSVQLASTDSIVEKVKSACKLPCLLFPGQVSQISRKADGILLLSLLSGRNPEYLIGKHVEAAVRIEQSELEVLPTAYLLVDGGRKSTVQYVTGTLPLPRHCSELAAATALAGQQLGMKLIYLEAGSGAESPVPAEMIGKVKSMTRLPLMVGGGLQTPEDAGRAVAAGADIVVVGNALEQGRADVFDFSAAVHAVSSNIGNE